MTPARQALLFFGVALAAALVLLGALLLRQGAQNDSLESSERRTADRKTAAADAASLLRNQRHADAQQAAEKALQEESTPDEAAALHLIAAAACRAQGLVASALQHAQTAASLRPSAFASTLRGLILAAGRDGKGAESAYLEALRLDDRYAPAKEHLGDLLWARGDAKGALRHYEEVLGWSGARETAHLKVSLMHYLLGEEKEGLAFADQFLKKNREGRFAALGHMARAECLAGLGRNAEAADAFERAAALAPTAERAMVRQSQALFLIRTGELARGADLLSGPEQGDSQEVRRARGARSLLGQVYFRLENWERSLTWFGDAAARGGRMDEYYAGVCLFQLNRMQEALLYFDRVRKPGGRFSERDEYALSATLLSARALSALGQAKNAEQRFEEAIRFWPDDARVWMNWGAWLLDHQPGRFRQKMAVILEKRPWRELSLLLAESHLRERRTGAALAALQDFLDRGASTPLQEKAAGDLALRLRQWDAAETHYRAALRLSDDKAWRAAIGANRVWIGWQRGETNAVDAVRAWTADLPESPALLYDAFLYFRSLRQEDAAEEYWNRALRQETSTKDRSLRSKLAAEQARRLVAEGRREAARERYEQALTWDPGNVRAAAEWKVLDGVPSRGGRE